jgi:hypothetical protein
MTVIMHESLSFCFCPIDYRGKLFLDLLKRTSSDLPSNVNLILLYADTIDEMIVYVVDECVLIVALGDDFEGVGVVLFGKVEANNIETIVEEGGEYAGFGVAFFGGVENVV